MFNAVYIIVSVVRLTLDVLIDLFFIRVLLSVINPDETNTVQNYLAMITDPLIYPVRRFLERFESIRALPFDISFFVTQLLLVILRIILPEIRY